MQSGMPGQPGAPKLDANGQPVEDVAAFTDPLLGESMLDDWEFTIVIAVSLDPPPAPTAPGAPVASR